MKNFKLITVLVLSFTLTLASCYRKKDTIARVTVLDINDQTPVGGVDVKLYYVDTLEPRTDLEQIQTTDASGVATFNYNELYKSGQAGFAILDIDAGGTVKAGIIRIEEEVTSEATVEI